MIACFDVYYPPDESSDTARQANAAAILFEDWDTESIVDRIVVTCEDVGDYEAGRFYQRELKPLLTLVDQIQPPIDTLIIDAYCHLSSEGAPGLGAHLHEALPSAPIVIGVAKNRFRDTKHAIELLRGESQRPLFVTSIGIDYQLAADRIKSMRGNHRFPTLLKEVDSLSRSDQ